ncbi:MAG TPA: DUF6263 family protein [Puia sp.]|nr:DUF6263 family protein [Puia sp.]
MNKTIHILLAFFLFNALIGCNGGGSKSTPASGDAIVLRFNVDKGIKFDYIMTMAMNMDQNVMGNTMHMTNKMKVGYIFEVTNDSAGWKTLNSTIDRIGMNVNAGGMSINFDTDSAMIDTTGPAGIMGKVFGAMKGGQFTFTMNEKGQVGSVRGMKEMMEKITEKENAPDAQMMMQSMGKAFDENNFKQNISQSFAVYPDNPVKQGDSWTKTLNINSNGIPMKSENTYTLQSVDGNKATIKVAAKISSADSTVTEAISNLSGTMDGTSVYEISTGMLTSGDMDMKMNVKTQQQPTPVLMDIKMTMTGKKL